MNDRLTLLDVTTIGLFFVVFGVLGVALFIYKLIKGGDLDVYQIRSNTT